MSAIFILLLVLLSLSIQPGSSYGGGGRRRGISRREPWYVDDDFQYGVEGDNGNSNYETSYVQPNVAVGGIDPWDYYASNKKYTDKKIKKIRTYGNERSHVYDYGPDTKKLLKSLLDGGGSGKRDEDEDEEGYRRKEERE